MYLREQLNWEPIWLGFLQVIIKCLTKIVPHNLQDGPYLLTTIYNCVYFVSKNVFVISNDTNLFGAYFQFRLNTFWLEDY